MGERRGVSDMLLLSLLTSLELPIGHRDENEWVWAQTQTKLESLKFNERAWRREQGTSRKRDDKAGKCGASTGHQSWQWSPGCAQVSLMMGIATGVV